MAEEEKQAKRGSAQAQPKAGRAEGQLRREQEDLRRRQREEAKEGAEEARSYVVESGDTLTKIAADLLGDAGRWPEIFEANRDKIEDPNLIHPGQELRIPS